MVDDDLSLLEKFRKGEKDAFNDLIQKYYRKVLNLVYRFYGCERHEAEDITQEVFLRTYRSLERFEGRSSFFTYIFKITMNLCLKKRKSKWRETPTEMEGALEHEPPAFQAKQESVEQHFEDTERQALVRNVVQSLPEEQRVVVILNRFNDMAYEEIADTLNITLAAVKSRLHRAKLTLKERLEPYMKEEERK
jgi:RNA polymerase sigma-70 factor, ECF subfamily